MNATNEITQAIITAAEHEQPQFREFPKIARLSRGMIVTEKLDGTNSQILITEDGRLLAGSRTRWITPSDDNFGFARWCEDHHSELLTLGPGRHYGEWWGSGINRGYGLPKDEKRLSLFNVTRWCLHDQEPQRIPTQDPRIEKFQERLPACVGLVPILARGPFDLEAVDNALLMLETMGSFAAPGFMKPEGVVVYHTAAGICFKKTIERDDEPKSKGVAK